MPTAEEYDAFAVKFDNAGDEAGDIGNALKAQRRASGVGGTFGNLVDMTLDAIVDHLEIAQPDLDAAAATCRSRARVCASYAEEVRQYNIDKDIWDSRCNSDPQNLYCILTNPPTPPHKPYSWVEI